MSNIVHLRAYVDPTNIPTLVLVDMQREFVESTRGLAVPNADEALAQARAALAHARAAGFPVAFVRWSGRSTFLNRATPFSAWIEGFVPTGADMIFERDRPSCYACERFGEVMGLGGGAIVLAGFAGESACLSTAVEAFHRGHKLLYLADASGSHSLFETGAREVHKVVTQVIRLYGEVALTADWIRDTARPARHRAG